jgi:HTH-type transcriptional regulator, global nitrogen regulator NrpRI
MQQNKNAKIAILKAIQDFDGPAGAARIAQRLEADGYDLQPRTIRFYLLQLDREGLTHTVSRRKGRALTARGRDELAHANVADKVGFVASKIDALGYRMTFRNGTGKGTIIANIATVRPDYLVRALEYMKQVFVRRLSMGTKLAIAREGQTIAGLKVPRDRIALATVCSVTLNGIMLSERIPVTSRFGGLLEMREGRPARFVELVEYRGTTIDPLEFFINAGMTRVRECARSGSGIIGASFREIPTVALDEVKAVVREMERHGLGGLLMIGRPNRPLLDIPVSEGRTGMIVVGGLNPIAALHEAGADVKLQSLAGLEDFNSFLPFQLLRDRFPG